jgi:hypothetical protein
MEEYRRGYVCIVSAVLAALLVATLPGTCILAVFDWMPSVMLSVYTRGDGERNGHVSLNKMLAFGFRRAKTVRQRL